MMNNKNKKLEQLKNNKKRRKLLTFLGIGFGLIAAGTTATILSVFKNTADPTKPDQEHTITFNKGTGTKITGNTFIKFNGKTTLNDLELPNVEKEYFTSSVKETFKNYEPFFEWRNSKTGEPVANNQVIDSSVSLTAVFADELTKQGLDYFSINFENNDDETVWLTGITRVASLKGRTLASINKPQPHTSDSIKTSFRGWALKENPASVLPQDTKIVTDMTLVPVYGETATLTFNPNGGEVVSGQSEIKVQTGTKFTDINYPEVKKINQTFEGWYKDEACTDPWKSTDTISKSEIIYAKYVEEGTGVYCIATFTQPEEGSSSVEYSGPTKVALPRANAWSACTRPNPLLDGYSVSHWEFSQDETNWELLKDDQLMDFDSVSIRPVMSPNLTNIQIFGSNEIERGETKEFETLAIPTSAKTGVGYSLYVDEGCTIALPESVATISQTEEGTCEIKVSTVTTSTYFYLKAWSLLPGKQDVCSKMKIIITDPSSRNVEFSILAQLEDDPEPYWYALKNVCDGTQAIEAYNMNNYTLEPKIIERSNFNHEIWVGDNVTTVPPGFLNSCTNFNSTIHLSNKTLNISNAFLAKCKNFNQPINFPNIQNIGEEFLYSDVDDPNSFNNTITLSATTIGQGFLENCTSFNSKLDLGSKLTTIGSMYNGELLSHFLQGCTSFNQDISFPASLTSVGNACMNNCNDFSSTINLSCNPTAFQPNYQNFSSTNSESAIHKVGFFVKSTTASYETDFITKFPDLEQVGTETSGSAYRARTKSANRSFENCTWAHLVNKINLYEDGKINEDEFCKSFTVLKNNVATVPTSFDDFLGAEKNIQWYGNQHKTRIVAKQFDTIAEGSHINEKALFTFELINILSNKDGKQFALPWDCTKNNTNYFASTIYNALEGVAYTTNFKGWIAYNTAAPLAGSKSAINFFDDSSLVMKDAFKKVKRWTEIKENGAWVEKEYTAKLYSPLASNLGTFNRAAGADSYLTEAHRQTFDFYKTFDTYVSGAKYYQRMSVKPHQATTTIAWSVSSYAQTTAAYYNCQNTSWTSNSGNFVWLGSPDTTTTNRAWQIRGPETRLVPDATWSALGFDIAFAI